MFFNKTGNEILKTSSQFSEGRSTEVLQSVKFNRFKRFIFVYDYKSF